MDLWVALAGFGVGFVVGLTGMGGGALMTPLLVLGFGVAPLAAVSSDLVASAVMKPFGGVVHLRRGTVDAGLVRWLCVGSIPAAFAGVFVARALGPGDAVEHVIRTALGVALLLAAAGLGVKTYLSLTGSLRDHAVRTGAGAVATRPMRVRRLATILVGVAGGLVVGITSVGSGSLIVIALLVLYPALRPNDLVGTDLVQAVPLVASAALAHLLFGDFQLALTAAVVVGSVPGVLLGASLSSRAPGGAIRSVLSVVLLSSGMKMLGASNVALALTLIPLAGVGSLAWALARYRYGRRGYGLPGGGSPIDAGAATVGAATTTGRASAASNSD